MIRLLISIIAIALLSTPVEGQEYKKQELLSLEYWGLTPNFPQVGDEYRAFQLDGLSFRAPSGRNWVIKPFAAAPTARGIEGHAFGVNAKSDPSFSRFHLLRLNILTGEITQKSGHPTALRAYATDRVMRIPKSHPDYQNCSFSEEANFDLPEKSALNPTNTVKWRGACEDKIRGFKTMTNYVIYYFMHPDNNNRIYKISIDELIPEGERSYLQKYEREAVRVLQTIRFLPLTNKQSR